MELHWTESDLLQLDQGWRRTLLNDMAGPRSGCLVGTVGEAGVFNLGVFNSVIHLGANPPLLGLILRPRTVPRHTYANLRANGYYTINHIGRGHVAAAHQASASYPEETSEFEAVGLTPSVGTAHPAPYVQESPVRIGLRYVEEHPIRANGTLLVVGQVVELFAPAGAVAPDGHLDLSLAGSVVSGGLDSYYAPEPLARYRYARPGESPQSV